MEATLIVILFVIAFVACMAIVIAIPAVVIMLFTGALHASGLSIVPALSFLQSCLIVGLIMTVAGLLRAAAGSYVD